MKTHIEANAIALEKEMLWLRSIFHERTIAYNVSKAGDDLNKRIFAIAPPAHEEASAPYVQFITEYDLSFEDRVLLILALVPHLDPVFIDAYGTRKITDARLPLFGIRGTAFKGTMPTMLTYLYLLAGSNLKDRMSLLQQFNSDHLFVRQNVLHVEPHYEGDPVYSGLLVISHMHMLLFTTGELMPLVKLPMDNNDKN